MTYLATLWASLTVVDIPVTATVGYVAPARSLLKYTQCPRCALLTLFPPTHFATTAGTQMMPRYLSHPFLGERTCRMLIRHNMSSAYKYCLRRASPHCAVRLPVLCPGYVATATVIVGTILTATTEPSIAYLLQLRLVIWQHKTKHLCKIAIKQE